MTLPLDLSRSRSILRRNARSIHLAIEALELRALMAASPVLIDGPARDAGSPANDHPAGWYAPARTISLAGRTIAPQAQPRTKGGGASGDVVPAGTTIQTNAAGLPLLTSRSDGQGLKVFLDFDGYGSDLPFSTDADTTTFNASEQLNIYDTWRDIVSFFAPFNVNVTTVQPLTGGNNPAFVWQRISNSIQGGAAYIGAINNFSSNGWNEASDAVNRHSGIAHEIGHQLGDTHQAEYDASGNKTDEYSDGYGNRDRPIMGIDFAENVRNWFYGRNSDSPLNLQDDIQTIANMISSKIGGDGFRVDDVLDTTAGATNIPAGGLISGILERENDVDLFRLTVSSAGTYQIAATPTFEASTAPKLELLDASSNLIAAKDDADRRNQNNNSEEFSLDLQPGTYFVRVSSSGDYAETGEYLVTAGRLLNGFTTADVGASTIFRAGTAAYDPATNTLTQIGGGTDIWSTSDEFRYTYTTLTGDGSITAKIDQLDNVDQHTKAGVMIRASTAANAAHVYVGIKPSGQLDPIVRTASNPTAAAVGNPSGATGPWVRLTRAGSLFTIERSSDGTNWNTYGTTTVGMADSVLIGFATSARASRAQAYSTFKGIAITGTLGTAAPTYNALPAPTGVSAVSVAGATTSLLLNWQPVAGATGYAIDRSVDGVNFTLWTTVGASATSFVDQSLFGSMRYFYRISAQGSGGTRSVPSASVSAVNKPNAPAAPNASYAKPVIRINSGQVLLNWTDVQGDNGYKIERSANGGGFSLIATTTRNHNAYNDSNLSPSTNYVYRITPITNVGDGAAMSYTTSVLTPMQAPVNFHIDARTTDSMTLAWNDLPNETGYRLERSLDANTWTLIGDRPANATTYTDNNLSSLNRYYYRLRAIDTNTVYGDPAFAFGATLYDAPLPPDWSDADIGPVKGLGGGSGIPGGPWTVLASGADIWGTSDQFNYLSRGVSGDGSIVARLTALDQTDYYTKAGVMFRESSAADSPYVFMHYSSGPGLQFEYRDAAGNASNNGFILASSARWLRLTRAGNTFTASYSSNGSSWTTAATRTVVMSNSATMGLAATSHNVDRMTIALFDNVTTTGAGVNAAPVITTPASASPATVTGNTTTLDVAATDDGGLNNLTYTWAVTSKPGGAADPFITPSVASPAMATATFTQAGKYTFTVTVRDAAGLTATSSTDVTVTLRASGGVYQYNASRPAISFAVNGDIGASLDNSDLLLENLTTGQTIPASSIVPSFDAGTGLATFRFNTAGNVSLPDGNYRATFKAGSVTEPSGVSLVADASFDFFVLAGDANRDRKVDFTDLVTLAQNYNTSNKSFSQGNFNYDGAGSVDFSDLVILAQHYNASLAALAPASVSVSVVGRSTKTDRGLAAGLV